jgi:uroporphyrin-III C-methyltransferase/precorrin-2 dehydrogenase/sirohydrochlorin ferrochelatase/uroporphyrin-III C-methyltransferase
VVSDAYWKELAATDDTLVFYMSAETLGDVVNHLISNNIDEDKLLAVIGQATTPEQKVVTCRLKDFTPSSYISPTIAIIGKVVALHEDFGWLQNKNEPQEYFKPIGIKPVSKQ